jgi:phytoene/squalene synthetase
VARHLRDLPRAELAVDLLGQRLAFLLQLRDLRRDIDRGVVLYEAQLLDLGLELRDWLLEIEKCRFQAGLMIQHKITESQVSTGESGIANALFLL